MPYWINIHTLQSTNWTEITFKSLNIVKIFSTCLQWSPMRVAICFFFQFWPPGALLSHVASQEICSRRGHLVGGINGIINLQSTNWYKFSFQNWNLPIKGTDILQNYVCLVISLLGSKWINWMSATVFWSFVPLCLCSQIKWTRAPRMQDIPNGFT